MTYVAMTAVKRPPRMSILTPSHLVRNESSENQIDGDDVPIEIPICAGSPGIFVNPVQGLLVEHSLRTIRTN